MDYNLKSFIYNSDLYIRCIPGKQLFRSSMVHSVVNRGDIFAIRVKDSLLTIIPGTAQVEHSTICIPAPAVPASLTVQEILDL